MNYVCVCWHKYNEIAGDPDRGIDPGTKWDDLPEDFVCPHCSMDKEGFSNE